MLFVSSSGRYFPCKEDNFGFRKLEHFFFFLHGRCEKNQESMRIFIILSCSDPTLETNAREKNPEEGIKQKQEDISGEIRCSWQRMEEGRSDALIGRKGVACTWKNPDAVAVHTLQHGQAWLHGALSMETRPG